MQPVSIVTGPSYSPRSAEAELVAGRPLHSIDFHEKSRLEPDHTSGGIRKIPAYAERLAIMSCATDGSVTHIFDCKSERMCSTKSFNKTSQTSNQ